MSFWIDPYCLALIITSATSGLGAAGWFIAQLIRNRQSDTSSTIYPPPELPKQIDSEKPKLPHTRAKKNLLVRQ